MAFQTDSTSADTDTTNSDVYTEGFEDEGASAYGVDADTSDDIDVRKLMDEPDVNDVRYISRSTLGQTLVKKPIKDAFKNGFEVEEDGDSESRAEATTSESVHELLEDTDFIDRYSLAEIKARRDGFAVMMYVLEDDSDGVYEDPYEAEVTSIQGINILTLDDLTTAQPDLVDDRIPLDQADYEIRKTGIVVDRRVNEPTYKEPIGYLQGPDEKAKERDRVKFVHKNRCQHLSWTKEVDHDLETDTLGEYEGDSVLLSSYHILSGMKKGNWAIMQTLFRYASKMHHIALPEDADDEDMEEAHDNLQNVNAKSELITPAGYEIEDFNTDGQLEPRDYFDVLFEQVCASNEMTKSVLFGTQSGTVSGSETDIKNYFNKVAKYQNNRAAEHIEDFVAAARVMLDGRTKGTYQPDLSIEWNPLFRLTALDRAEVMNRKMQTARIAVDTFALKPVEVRRLLDEEWAAIDLDTEEPFTAEEIEMLESLNLHQVGQEPTSEVEASKAAEKGESEQAKGKGNPEKGQYGGGMKKGQKTASNDPTTQDRADGGFTIELA
jgi:hypothetical protein